MLCILNLLYTSEQGLRDTWVYVTLKIERKTTGLLCSRTLV